MLEMYPMLQITAHPYTLDFKRPAATSRGALQTRDVVFLRATHTERPGLTGWGECGPLPGLSIDDRPDFQAQVHDVCQQINAGHAPATLDLAHWPSLAFGLEMALLDLQTGGQQRLFDTPFSNGAAALTTHGLIWMDTPAKVVEQIERKLEQGFRVIKLKVGALPLAEECAILAAIRQNYAVEQVTLRLDANGAFTPATTLATLHQLAQFDVHFLEQPIKPGQWPALAEICAQSPIPIALDEELIGVQPDQQQVLLATIRPQHLIIKPGLLGGFAASKSWIRLAENYGSGWWINSMLESNIGLNAICQWTSALDSGRVHGLGTGQLFANNIPAPLGLRGPQLEVATDDGWDFSCIQ